MQRTTAEQRGSRHAPSGPRRRRDCDVAHPTLVSADLASGELIRLLPDCQPEPLGIHAVYLSRQHQPQLLRVMVDFLCRSHERRSGAMGPGNRLGNEASDLNRQVPRQRQRNSAAPTEGELTTDRTRRCRPFPRMANFSVRFLAKARPLEGRPNYRCGSDPPVRSTPANGCYPSRFGLQSVFVNSAFNSVDISRFLLIPTSIRHRVYKTAASHSTQQN